MKKIKMIKFDKLLDKLIPNNLIVIDLKIIKNEIREITIKINNEDELLKIYNNKDNLEIVIDILNIIYDNFAKQNIKIQKQIEFLKEIKKFKDYLKKLKNLEYSVKGTLSIYLWVLDRITYSFKGKFEDKKVLIWTEKPELIFLNKKQFGIIYEG